MKSVIRSTGWIAQICAGILSLILVSLVVADNVTVNFRDADIRSVIESVSEITGKAFIIDPRVKGKMTIIAPDSIDADSLYEVFLSALQVHGYQAVSDGQVTRIVPSAQAFQQAGGGGGELATRIFTLSYVTAPELVPVIKPMLSPGAQVQAHAASNRLIVTDTVSQLARVERMIAEVDDADQAQYDIVELEHMSAAEAVAILREMKHIQRAQPSIVEDEYNNRLIVGGSPVVRRQVVGLLKQLDMPSSSEDGVEVIYLHYAQAVNLKPMIEKILTSRSFLRLAGETEKNSGNDQYQVEADEMNNALLISAPGAVINNVKKLVRKLDMPRVQVLIEAVLAEVTQDQANKLSVQLAAVGKQGGFIVNFDDIIPALLAGAIGGDDNIDGIAVPNGISAGGANYNEDSGRGIAGLITALKSDADTNILSSPSIVTMDNEEATITVGQEVPFITGSYTGTGSVSPSNPFQTIEREEVGIKLTVRPQVNEGDAVRLEISQEASSILANAALAGTADLVTSKRTITTNVMVNDGEILVLGGLNDDRQSLDVKKVPVLGSIPFVGAFFRSTEREVETRVLIVFIRPTILRNSGEASAISRAKYDMLRTRQVDFGERTKAGDATVVLPSWDEANAEYQ
ncbi:MAG: type II secretion system secretin GspD [Pseudomonadales bacterium]